MPPDQVFTVTQLTRRVRGVLESGVGAVWVEGEISNHRRQPSGHHYFTLKDAGAQLSCVLFRGSAAALGSLRLGDGQQVQLFGELTVYEARGQYQLLVKLAQPKGLGSLQARFEALKRGLQAEGLFDAGRKQPLPRFPASVGIVTSPTGAALRDMLNILTRRAPWVSVLIHPVRVQGDEAAGEIAAAVRDFNRPDFPVPVDLIVVARGGGSIEDLWAFNEEMVARAIAASRLPVVSAVGHEIDFTIADFVADLRAPTPSAAAELIAPDREELERRLEVTTRHLSGRLRESIVSGRSRLRVTLSGALHREPLRCMRESRMEVDRLGELIRRGAGHHFETFRQRLAALLAVIREHRPDQQLTRACERLGFVRDRIRSRVAHGMSDKGNLLRETSSKLRLLGPQATLDRGYTITTDAEGRLLRSRSSVVSGIVLRTRFADGETRSIAE